MWCILYGLRFDLARMRSGLWRGHCKIIILPSCFFVNLLLCFGSLSSLVHIYTYLSGTMCDTTRIIRRSYKFQSLAWLKYCSSLDNKVKLVLLLVYNHKFGHTLKIRNWTIYISWPLIWLFRGLKSGIWESVCIQLYIGRTYGDKKVKHVFPGIVCEGKK